MGGSKAADKSVRPTRAGMAGGSAGVLRFAQDDNYDLVLEAGKNAREKESQRRRTEARGLKVAHDHSYVDWGGGGW